MSASATIRKPRLAGTTDHWRRRSSHERAASAEPKPQKTARAAQPIAQSAVSDAAVSGPVAAPQARADDQLVERAQAGERRAFDALVGKYQSRVIAVVNRYVGEADALDVAQEAFIKAYRALSAFRGDSAFYTWMHRIAVNSCKNYLLARSRRPSNQDIDIADAELFGHADELSDAETPEARLLAQELEHKVVRTIDGLPHELRRAIVLRELEGLSYEEIAEMTECPIGTVRSRLFRAREAVDAVVDPLLVS